MADRQYQADRLRLIPGYTVFEAASGLPRLSVFQSQRNFTQRNLTFGIAEKILPTFYSLAKSFEIFLG